jgi:outer membrane protein OmpA-like peptidoglycan-associated protein
MQRIVLLTICTAAIALLVGCATVPAEYPELVQARAAYQRAAQDPAVRDNAPVALHEAERALNRAENATSAAEREHYAYLVQKRVAIAEAFAGGQAAENEIAQLQERRENILAQRREQELEISEQRTAEAQRQAEIAQLELQRMQEAQREAEIRQYQQQAEQEREERLRIQEELEQLEQTTTQQTERGIVLNISDVLFEFDEATLKPGAALNLSKLVQVLNEHPDRNILIEGHTDSLGDASYNEQLSQQRAEAVANFLRNQGIADNRIMTRGYGESYPIASNETQAGRQQNRRVEIVLMDAGRTFEQSMRDSAQAGTAQGS